MHFYNLNSNSILQECSPNAILIILFVFYLLFQVFRFVALVMFAIFMVECCVFHNKTSVNCEPGDINFTTYRTPGCSPFCWKGLWIACSVITCLVVFFMVFAPVESRYIQRIRPASNTSIFCSLIVKPYFRYLNFIVMLVVVYDAIVQRQNDVNGSEEVEIVVIVSKLLSKIESGPNYTTAAHAFVKATLRLGLRAPFVARNKDYHIQDPMTQIRDAISQLT